MEKKLYKDQKNKKLCGVCAGVGNYLGVDHTVVRLGLVLFCLLGGAGLLAYIICAVVMPDEPGTVG